MKQAQPHELRLAGDKRHPGKVFVSVGSGVPEAAAAFLQGTFLSPRFTILHSMRGSETRPPDLPAVEDLAARGYDLATLRLTVFMKGHGTPRKPREHPSLPGSLCLRWGWLPKDHSPDLCGLWGAPARRRDLNLLFHLLSDPWLPTRASSHEFVTQPTGMKTLEQLGWDLRTLDFRVDVVDRKARLAAMAAEADRKEQESP